MMMFPGIEGTSEMMVSMISPLITGFDLDLEVSIGMKTKRIGRG